MRKILQNNSKVFCPSIGQVVGRHVTIMTDETATPVIQIPRRTPYNHAAKAEKISYQINQDIIEKVPDDETPSWISLTVIAPKQNSDQIRLFMDMRMANKAILWPYTQLPSMEMWSANSKVQQRSLNWTYAKPTISLNLPKSHAKLRRSTDQMDCSATNNWMTARCLPKISYKMKCEISWQVS